MKKTIVIFHFLNSFTVAHALLFLVYLKDIGVDMFYIGILFAITYVSNLMTEIPFGYFADRKSKKLSYYIGSLATVISLMIFISTRDFQWIVASSIMYGMGLSGKSGSAEAILINNLDSEYQKTYFEIGNKVSLFCNAFIAIAMGFLYKLTMIFPFFISLAAEIMLIIFVIFVKEVKANNSEQKDDALFFKSTILSIYKNYDIYLFLGLMYLVIPQLSVYLPSYLTDNIKIEYIGVLLFIFNVIPLFGSKIYDLKLSEKDNKKVLYITLIYLTLLLLLMYISGFELFIFFYGLSRIANGWIFLLISKLINSISTNTNRAIMLSIKSTIMSIMFIVSDPLFGYIISRYGIKFSYLLSAIVILIGLFTVVYSRRKYYV